MTRAADTNQAESFFSRLRRAEIGQHHRIGIHLHQYAGEMAWREDNRRKATGTQFMNVAGAALGHPVSQKLDWILATISNRFMPAYWGSKLNRRKI